MVAIVLSAMAGNAIHVVYRDYEDTLQRRYALVRDMAKVVDEHVHRVIGTASVSLDHVAAMVSESGNLDAVRSIDNWKRLREYAAHLEGGESLWVVSADGKTILESASYPGRQAPTRDYTQALQDGVSLFVGPATADRGEGGHFVFTLARPLRDDAGQPLGVVLAVMSVAHLTDFYDLLGFDYNPLIGVYRNTGEVVSRRPNMQDVVGKSIANGPLFQEKLKEAPEGLFLSASPLDSMTRIAAYRTVRDYGLIVLTGIDRDRGLEDWRQRSLHTLLETVVGMLAVLLTMAWGFRYLDRERRTQLQLTEARASAARASAERDEISRLAKALREAKEAADAARQTAEAANRSKGQFLAGLSHELRTPLNAIIGFSDLIARESEGPVGSPQYRRFAINVRDSGQHLLELINEILDHAKSEVGALRLEESIVDLEASASFATRLLTPRAERAGVILAVHVAPEVRFLRADERRLRQIILNLVSNAVKYTPSGGSVTVSAALEDGALAIRVTDTGMGIATEDLGRVMEPFARVETSVNQRIEGTGLGLPLTKRLVELHGGSLSLSSALDKGTTALVQLPGIRVLLPGQALPPADGGRRSLSIALVEDDPTIRRGVSTLLREWGHRVIEAANANEALVILQGPDALDLLFSDIVMPPGMSGTELAQHARRLRPDLPILLASGSPPHAVAADETRIPGVAIIAKPYDIGELKNQISHLCGWLATGTAAATTESRTPRVLVAEDLEINRELLSAIFRDSGYHLDLVADGAAAVRAMTDADYDLVLMDVSMPEMDGLEATRLIRAMPPPRNQVPILALTAGNLPSEIALCQEAGMNGSIGKPYDRNLLLQEVARVIANACAETV
jgi:signal transduction histidine kinase/DNA-binding response OmpR family regulator